MANKINVTVLRQKVFHDGLSMVVLKPGNGEVEDRFIAGLVAEGTIEAPDGWVAPAAGAARPAMASADGQVAGLNFDPANQSDLTSLDLGQLLQVAAVEGVIPDLVEMRNGLTQAILDKRAAATASEDEGDGLDAKPAVLSGKTKAELLEVAANEGVDADDSMTKAEIVDAIEAAREADGSPPA